MSLRATLAFLLIIVIAALVYLGFRHSGGAALSNSFSCPNCNVIIIGVDTLRADHVHAFGYDLDTTPTIDALASQGFSFTNAISASNWTVPAFMSIMTSVYPSVHRVVNKYTEYDPTDPKKQIVSNLQQLSPQIETLAQAMKAQGYATGGFTGDAGVGHQFGYGQGFDVYTDDQTFGGFSNSASHALSWLDSLQKGQKFFMFFHGYDLHGQFNLPAQDRTFVPTSYTGPYTGSPQEEANLREAQLTPAGISLTPADVAFWTGLYDSKLKTADTELGTFLSELESRGLLQNTVIVLVSDHGEELYDHGGIDHGQSLYDELIHVPLIIKVPGSAGGKSTNAQVSTMDVAPTIFGILGISPDKTYASQMEGQNLMSYMTGATTTGRDVFIETDYRDFIHLRGVRTADGWMYIRNLVSGTEELYNLNTDPGEKNNILAVEPEKAKVLSAELDAHIQNDLHADPNAKATIGCLPVYATECQQ